MTDSNPPFQPIAPLSEAKLETFLQHISLGALALSAVKRALLQPNGRINVLKTLIPLYTSSVPWGGIAYHYSNTPINSLDPEAVFSKLILRGRGGHCLEMVPLFASVLLALGYDLYLTGARISTAITGDGSVPGFHGWSHLVLIAAIEGRKYVVDPQFIDTVEPALLDPTGPEITFVGVPSTLMRLRYCRLADVVPNGASKSGAMTWIFEFKRSKEEEFWSPAYIFSTETEWFLDDLPVMNVWLAKAVDSYLVAQFQIKRLLLAGPDDPDCESEERSYGPAEDRSLQVPEISGAVELANDHLRVWRYGNKVVDETITTERERIDILKKWFGIELTEEEIMAVRGRPTALKN